MGIKIKFNGIKWFKTNLKLKRFQQDAMQYNNNNNGQTKKTKNEKE